MARTPKTTDTATTTTTDAAPGGFRRAQVTRKTAFDWGSALAKAEAEAWRGVRIRVQIRDRIYAGSPASLDAANAMIKARGLEELLQAKLQEDPEKLRAALDDAGLTDIIKLPLSPDEATPTAVAEAANEVKDEGLCVFHRRPDRPGVWMPSNNFKAMLKENLSVLGITVQTRGSKGAMAEGVFVRGVMPASVTNPTAADFDWIYLGEKIDGVAAMVAHTTSARGPVSSIKRHEYRTAPVIEVDVLISNADAVASKLSDENIARVLVHAAEHGLGACRSQGAGKFELLQVEDIDVPAGVATRLRAMQEQETARAAG